MYSDARKISIIEAVIKTEDDATLKKIEDIVRTDSFQNDKPSSKKFTDLVGILAPDEADAIKQTIDENFEKINPDDWK